MPEHDDDFSRSIPKQLQAMRGSSSELPPPELEDRVVAELTSRGLIRAPAWRRWASVAAAAILALSIGFTAGRFSLSSVVETEESPRFVLLLYDTLERDAARGPEVERKLAEEYSAWARQLGAAGRFVAGDPIHGESRMLRQAAGGVEALPVAAEASGEIVVGYFMIRARDHAEAVEIAKQCPHLKYEGGVLVRQVGVT